ITDRSYIIKDGKVQTHGTPYQIVHDSIAINEYLGDSFADNSLGASLPSVPEQPREQVVHLVLEQEKLHRLIDRLKTDYAEASAELAQHGRDAVLPLLEALTRRDVEMRRLAFGVLQ